MRGESGVGEMDKSIAANALVPEVVNSGLSAARSIQGGPVRIDCELFVASIEGVVLPLTRLEFDILHYLIGHRHRVVAQSEIVRVVVGGSLQPDSSLVRVHIAHLRRKLCAHRGLIATVRARGYRFIDGARVERLANS